MLVHGDLPSHGVLWKLRPPQEENKVTVRGYERPYLIPHRPKKSTNYEIGE